MNNESRSGDIAASNLYRIICIVDMRGVAEITLVMCFSS
jgi:hypothetical protein